MLSIDHPKDKFLIINADDFGLLPEVNQAIEDCFESQSLTSATLMVNAEHAAEAAAYAVRNPRFGVGLHFTLTQGRPLCPPGKVPSLVDSSGRFHCRRVFEWNALLCKIDPKDVARELDAQIERFESFGVRMTHMDSHHHAHMFPAVFRTLSRRAAGMRIPLRIPHVSYKFIKFPDFLCSPRAIICKLMLSMLQRSTRPDLLQGLKTPDRFCSLYDFIPRPQSELSLALKKLLEDVPPGFTELMVHPAYLTPRLESLFDGVHLKDLERRMLMSFSLVAKAQLKGITCVSYAQM